MTVVDGCASNINITVEWIAGQGTYSIRAPAMPCSAETRLAAA